jgi:predicted MFS family arabinose efflux permease
LIEHSLIASGVLTDGPGWRWVFFISVPVGVVLDAMAAIFLPADVRGHLGEAAAVTDLRAAGGPTAWGRFEAGLVEPARK